MGGNDIDKIIDDNSKWKLITYNGGYYGNKYIYYLITNKRIYFKLKENGYGLPSGGIALPDDLNAAIGSKTYHLPNSSTGELNGAPCTTYAILKQNYLSFYQTANGQVCLNCWIDL